jgi:hypothetical protein
VDFYIHSVDLPYSNINIKFRELTTQEQILLAKINIIYPYNKDTLLECCTFIKDTIESCVKNKDDFRNINILDYIMFVVKIRMISIGDSIEFLLNNEKIKTKVKLNLNNYISNVYNASNFFELEENSLVKDDERKMQIKINWPSLDSIEYFYKIFNTNNEYEIINNSLHEFIEYIKIKDFSNLYFKNFTTEQKIDMFGKLPLVLKTKVQDLILKALDKLINYELFNISTFKDQKINLYNLSYVEHLKMFFSYDLKSLHEEIYYLSTNNIPPEYTLKLSPAERNLYLSIIREHEKRKESGSVGGDLPVSGGKQSDALKKLALEFGQNPT